VHGPGSSSSRPASPQTELAGALADCKTALGGIGLFSFMINILMLTGAIFMLQVYDRVLPSRSLPTLVGLIVLALTMFAFLGALDFLRGRVLVRIGGYLD
jgi:ATP-binding cassette subfamily C protein PrsD